MFFCKSGRRHEGDDGIGCTRRSGRKVIVKNNVGTLRRHNNISIITMNHPWGYWFEEGVTLQTRAVILPVKAGGHIHAYGMKR